MDHLAYTIINTMLKRRKALSRVQLIEALVGYKTHEVDAKINEMERMNLIVSKFEGRHYLFTPTIQGFTAWDTYLLATKNPTDLAGIE